ncbi:MAG TPA: tripartite tricarboxylate transporter TctB family protein [Afifellaceae bacterium]|nr:tripartite tricarboxylate transporter TctB family protein [Afifellaceae bacterium]
MTANRISGLLVALCGLLLWLVVIPANTETVGSGWIRPDTLPQACAVALIGLGLIQSLPRGRSLEPTGAEVLRAGLFAALAFLAVWAMTVAGFRLAAPAFALALMLLVGERRPGWLAVGAVGVPAAIWLTAVPLLDRTLP